MSLIKLNLDWIEYQNTIEEANRKLKTKETWLERAEKEMSLSQKIRYDMDDDSDEF